MAEATYDGTAHEYEVSVTFNGKTLKEKFRAGYPPRFGIDVADAAQCSEISEKLLQKLEHE